MYYSHEKLGLNSLRQFRSEHPQTGGFPNDQIKVTNYLGPKLKPLQ